LSAFYSRFPCYGQTRRIKSYTTATGPEQTRDLEAVRGLVLERMVMGWVYEMAPLREDPIDPFPDYDSESVFSWNSWN